MPAARESPAENTAHKRQINDAIRETVEGRAPNAAIAFVCECGSPGCFTAVWLSVEDYDAARTDDAWTVLAPGHERPDGAPPR